MDVDDGEQGLVSVVCEDEFTGGDEAAPRLADGAAAEDGLGRQAANDLPDDDCLG